MGCFRCLECGELVRNVEQQFKYTEPLKCPAPVCGNKCAPSMTAKHVPCGCTSVQRLPSEKCKGSGCHRAG